MSTATPYKPSPLSFNSPRTSPFRRPESPFTRSPSTVRATTPTNPGAKPTTPTQPSPEKTQAQTAAKPDTVTTAPGASAGTPWTSTRGNAVTNIDPPPSPTPINKPSASRPMTPSMQQEQPIRPLSFSRPNGVTPLPTSNTLSTGRTAKSRDDPIAHIPPAQLHSMRESFAVLDRSNTGNVSSSDVADMLNQLGLDASPSSLAAFFPSSSSNASNATINLATYLNTLASLLAPLSSAEELGAAFAAFDDDDAGEVDVGELKAALMHAAPEGGGSKLTERDIATVMEGFSGKRAFGKGKGLGRGDVFRYHDFVAAVSGGAVGGETGAGAKVGK